MRRYADDSFLWEQALRGMSLKWLGEPVRMEDFSASELSKIIPIRRFLIHQKGEPRPIYNCRLAGVKYASSVGTPIIFPCANDACEIGLRLLDAGCIPAFWKSDHRDAFKQLPITLKMRRILESLFDPPWMVFCIYSLYVGYFSVVPSVC